MKYNKSNRMGKWSDFPEELMGIIGGKIRLVEDFITFRGVCSTWRSAAPKENFTGNTQLACAVHAGNFVRPPKAAINLLQHRPPSTSVVASTTTSQNYKKPYIATKGWLFAISKNGETCLFHPFSSAHIILPHASTLSECNDRDLISQAVLSSSPSFCPNYALIVLYNQSGLAYWRPGRDGFTELVGHYKPNNRWVSITCCNEQLYTLDHVGTIVIWDMHIHVPVVQLVMEQPPDNKLYQKDRYFTFLAELNGEVFIVGKAKVAGPFFFHRIDVTHREYEVKLLGNRVYCGLQYGTCFFMEPSEILGCPHMYLDILGCPHMYLDYVD